MLKALLVFIYNRLKNFDGPTYRPLAQRSMFDKQQPEETSGKIISGVSWVAEVFGSQYLMGNQDVKYIQLVFLI